jgi:CheY-like chemotaxis protein
VSATMAGASQHPTSRLQFCLPYFLMPRDEHIAFRVSTIRSKFSAYVFTSMLVGYPVFMAVFDHFFDILACTWLFVMTFLEICAIRRGSDKLLIYTTRALQASMTTLSLIKVVLHWRELLECPAQASPTMLSPVALNCSGSPTTAMSSAHVFARSAVSSYSVFVLLPVLCLIHLIPAPVFVVPVLLIGCIDMMVASTYVSLDSLIMSVINPLFAGIFISIIGYRADFLALKTWQEMKRREAWLASVAHNIGTPLTTISYATSAMWGMDAIEDTRPMLKNQRVAVDYLRCVYSNVMYQKNGRNPVGKQQRFRIKTLQRACQHVTETYGSSMFPNIAVEYYIEEEALPEYIVSDWAKIQQCVVNLVTNAQKHFQDGGNSSKKKSGATGGGEDGIGNNVLHSVDVSATAGTAHTADVAAAGGDGMKVTVRFLLNSDLNQLHIEVCDGGAGVNDALVNEYFRRNGTGLGSVGVMMEALGGGYGGHRNTDGMLGSTFYIDIPLHDDVDMDVLHEDDHTTLFMSVEQRQRDEETRGDDVVELEKKGARHEEAGKSCSVSVSEDSEESKTRQTIITSTTGPGKQTAAMKAGQFKLLLVEDMMLNRAFIRLWLEHDFPELSIVDASNGKEALEQLQRASDTSTPFDMVFMDICMPVMDGFACLEEMTILYGDKKPPTIAITTGATHDNPAFTTLEPGTGAKFDQWWDKTDQNAMLCGVKKLMRSIEIERAAARTKN